MNNQPKQSVKRANANHDTSNDNQSNAVDKSSITPEPKKEGWHPKEEKHKCAERRYWRVQSITTGITLLFSLIAACGAVLGVYIAYKAFLATRDAVREAQKQTIEARRQSDAAESQIAIAKDTEQKQLRSYVIFSTKEIEHFVENGTAHVQAIIENVGQTPVYDGTWSSGISVLPAAQVVNIQLTSCPSIMSAPDTRHFYFGKFGYPEKDRDRQFTRDEIDSIKSGISAVLFYGRICYRDIFKEVHRTDFCVLWRWMGSGLAAAIYCEHGNDAD